ncbi:MAG: L-seryl-tRNA(Sec) selenium transferase [bacterium]
MPNPGPEDDIQYGSRCEEPESVSSGFSGLGSVDSWLGDPRVLAYLECADGGVGITLHQAKEAVRKGLEDARNGSNPSDSDLRDYATSKIGARLEEYRNLQLARVINATGIILHTNLGRAPVHAELARLATDIASGYVNLEYDLASGARSGRHAGLNSMLRSLSGAEDALVVNNCAAALYLILSALATTGSDRKAASGLEVIVSRGELVQIGGGFRIPSILAASGAVLREVGTTNITTQQDYAEAVNEQTAMILKVHPSNFKQYGFTESVPAASLVPLAARAGIPLIEDLGSASLASERDIARAGILSPRPAIRAGVDLVCFSGDKALGGPQAGIILGKSRFIGKLRRHPVMRTMRVDKWTAALLSAVLWACGNNRLDLLPVYEMATRDPKTDLSRAKRIAKKLNAMGLRCDVVEHPASLGGGTSPGESIPSYAISPCAKDVSALELASRLRAGKPPVVGVIKEGKLLLNMRTVFLEDDNKLFSAIAALLA